MTSNIRFGADGWRGKIARDYTFDNVQRVAQAFADYLREDAGMAGRSVVVGYDKRFASEDFAAAVAEVLAGNDLHVFLSNVATPTPVLSFTVLNKQAAGAVIITASHNPPTYNGFKVRDDQGISIAPDDLKRIEARIPGSVSAVKQVPLQQAIQAGQVETFDPAPAYVEYIKQHLDLDVVRQAGFRVVYDAMWGVGAGWLKRLLGSGSTEIHPIREQRNPLFPGMRRPEPIPPNIAALSKEVVDLKADVGIATDGDADRVGLVDQNGDFVTQLQVAGLLMLYLAQLRQQRGAIVKTLTSTVMLNVLGRQFGLDVFETAVSPKYIGAKFVETDAMLGATESGGFMFRGLTERDGILSALYLLDLMARTGKQLDQLLEWLYETVGARYYYDRIDTPLSLEQHQAVVQRLPQAEPTTLGGLAVTGRDRLDGFRFHLADGGWLLIRFSETEPIVRVYCETTDESRVKPLLDEGLKLAGLA